MSARKYINGAMARVARNVYPNSNYVTATFDQLSQVEVSHGQVAIFVNQQYQLTRDDISSSSQTTADFSFIIGLLDEFDSNAQEVDNLVSTADILTDQYLRELEGIFEDIAIQIIGITKTPIFKRGGETLTGVMTMCTLVVNDCLPNQYPDLSEYYGRIDRTVDPYDWKGITKNDNARIYQ